MDKLTMLYKRGLPATEFKTGTAFKSAFWIPIVTAGLLMVGPHSMAASPNDLLAKNPTDDISKNVALSKAAITLGMKVVAANCISCHGANLKGVPGKHAPDLSDAAVLYGSDNLDADVDQIFPSDIETTIKYGIRANHPKTRKLAVMPSFAGLVKHQEGGYPTLTPQQISDLTEFLVVLQKQPGEAAAAERGKLLFANQGGCYDCHGRDAKGNPGIGAPDLSLSKYLYGNDRKSIRASIREGRAGMMPAYEGVLAPTEIKAAAYYLFSVREHARH